MKNSKYIFIIFLFVVISLNKAYSQEYANYLTENTIIAGYLNLGKIYTGITNKLVSVLTSNNSAEKQKSQFIIESLAKNGVDKLNGLNGYDVAQLINQWNLTGFFIPNGDMIFSISSDLTPYISLGAKVDTVKFMDFARKSLIQNGISIVQEQEDYVKLKTKIGADLYILKNGIIWGSLPEKIVPPSNSEWKVYSENASYADVYATIDFDSQAVKKTLDRGNFKQNSLALAAYLQTILPNLSVTSWARITFKEDSAYALLKYGNSKVCKHNQENIKDNLRKFKVPASVTEKQNNEIEIFASGEKNMLLALNSILQTTPGVYVQSMANYRKLKEDYNTKDCYSNIYAIQGAYEMFSMDHEVNSKNISFDKILKYGRLKKIPVCLASGTYEFSNDTKEKYIVKCSIHGVPKSDSKSIVSVNQNSELEKSLKKCRSNMRLMKSAVSMYVMDTGEDYTYNLDIIKLVPKYFTTLPECPDNGKYKVLKNCGIECSLHGELE